MVDWNGKRTNKGGVLITAALGVACSKVKDLARPHKDIDACSCLLYPYHSVGEVVRISGVYIPPSADATPHMLRALTDLESQSTDSQGNVLSHLLVGDFNQHTWNKKTDELFHEWMGDTGMWELSDPRVPTHRKGSTLDKFLLLPGTNIPEEWLPSEMSEWGGQWKTSLRKNTVLTLLPFIRRTLTISRSLQTIIQ